MAEVIGSATAGLRRRAFLAAGPAGLLAPAATWAADDPAPADGPATAAGGGEPPRTPDATGRLELARAVRAPSSPTGVVVTRSGRMFVFMPRLAAELAFSIGEVAADGAVTPWPDPDINRPDTRRPQETLFHVPNGVVDRNDRLWVLDAGLLGPSGPPVAGGPKLICYDLETGNARRLIPLGPGVEPTSSLNDLRLRHGPDGPTAAFISDQGQDGHGAIVAVDLASGRVTRRLARHYSTDSQKGVLKVVEGQPVVKRGRDGAVSEVQGGANGIAISPDGARIYYAPLMGRRLYSVDADALLDAGASDAAVAATVRDLGEKGMTGGLLCDDRDRVYLALQELNAVGRRDPDGRVTILATDPRLIWADTFWITPDRTLYVSSSQVNRRPEYNGGTDRQRPPYAILKMQIDAGPA